MKFNYKEADKERSSALLNDSGWNLNILTHVLFMASVAGSPVDEQLCEPNCNFDDLNMILAVNGIEIDLEKGLNRIVGILNKQEQKKQKIDELLFEFQNKLSEIQ